MLVRLSHLAHRGIALAPSGWQALLNRLKNEAENLFRSRGENVAAIEIVRSEKPTLRVFH
jgi:hypothetical protein